MTNNKDSLNKLKGIEEQSSKGVETIQDTIDKSNKKGVGKMKEVNIDKAEYLVVDHLIKTSFRQKVEEFNIPNPTKAHLKSIKEKYAKEINSFLDINNIKVKGFDTTSDFVDYMVAELVGYSVLEDAFADPEVSDIYVSNYNTIFVGKDGKNIRYEKCFKSPEHFNIVLDRFLLLDGKSLNKKDKEVVDFVLYGDRGTATYGTIPPNDFTVTIRKCKEDLTQQQLLEGSDSGGVF